LRHDDNNATGDALFSGLSCLACTWWTWKRFR
jgi:hypothetical protein